MQSPSLPHLWAQVQYCLQGIKVFAYHVTLPISRWYIYWEHSSLNIAASYIATSLKPTCDQFDPLANSLSKSNARSLSSRTWRTLPHISDVSFLVRSWISKPSSCSSKTLTLTLPSPQHWQRSGGRHYTRCTWSFDQLKLYSRGM